jgi:hypothetical protein
MRFCEIREYDTDGKAVRGQLFYDQVTMLVQLGHMPPPGADRTPRPTSNRRRPLPVHTLIIDDAATDERTGRK